jgi:hypothetical protein
MLHLLYLREDGTVVFPVDVPRDSEVRFLYDRIWKMRTYLGELVDVELWQVSACIAETYCLTPHS